MITQKNKQPKHIPWSVRVRASGTRLFVEPEGAKPNDKVVREGQVSYFVRYGNRCANVFVRYQQTGGGDENSCVLKGIYVEDFYGCGHTFSGNKKAIKVENLFWFKDKIRMLLVEHKKDITSLSSLLHSKQEATNNVKTITVL